MTPVTPVTPAGPAAGVGLQAVEADALAAAALACPAVASLHPGGLRRVATYLPGRRVEGVRVDDAGIEVAVVAAYGVPVVELVRQVRAGLAPLAGGRAVHVHVGDVLLPDEQPPAPPPGPAG